MMRFWREKGRVLGFVGSPLVFWLLIGSGFGDLAFFFPGALVLTVMFSAVFSTMSLIEDRREGFLRSMLVSPAPRSSMVLGKMLGSSTLAWVQGLLFLCFLPMTGYAPGAAGWRPRQGFVSGSFAFTALGLFHGVADGFDAGLPRGDEPGAVSALAHLGRAVSDGKGAWMGAMADADQSIDVRGGGAARTDRAAGRRRGARLFIPA